MKFPGVAIKIWLIFSFAFLFYSAVQFIILTVQLSGFSDQEYINLMNQSGGAVLWSSNGEGDGEIREQLRELYFPEELIEKILVSDAAGAAGERSYEWTGEDDEILYSLIITEKEGKRSYRLNFIMSEPFSYSMLIYDGISTSLITLLVMLIPAWLISFLMVRPLLRMEKWALRIAEGDLGEKIEVKGRDEIGALGRSLETMREQLKRKNESQQFFFQSASHELKTPITVIRSHVQAIEDGIGDSRDNLSIIDREAQRLNRKVGKLVSIGKVEYLADAGRDAVSFDMRDLLEGILDDLSGGMSAVDWRLPGGVFPLRSRPELVRILFENILDNQFRYARSRIDIHIERGEGHLVIEISNDGEPVEESGLNLIFGLFQKGTGGISGLGLYIAAEICRVLEGDIGAENREGRTVFSVRIPSIT